jgi:hypothetical protein
VQSLRRRELLNLRETNPKKFTLRHEEASYASLQRLL